MKKDIFSVQTRSFKEYLKVTKESYTDEHIAKYAVESIKALDETRYANLYKEFGRSYKRLWKIGGPFITNRFYLQGITTLFPIYNIIYI